MSKYYGQDCRERCVAKLEKTLPESGNILSKMKQYFDKQFQCIQKELPQQQKSLKRKLHRILRRHCQEQYKFKSEQIYFKDLERVQAHK